MRTINVEGLPEWPQWRLGSEAYLDLGDDIEVGYLLGKAECEALDEIRAQAAAAVETPSGR